MRWPVFDNSNHKPRLKTMAERLREAEKVVRLPRQVHHAIERERRISLDDVRDMESTASKELRQSRERGTADLEALVAGSKEEMKMLFKQLVLTRGILKKLERSYLYHYYRHDVGQRMLTKIRKIKLGVSGKRPSTNLKALEERIAQLNPEEQAIAKRLLNMT